MFDGHSTTRARPNKPRPDFPLFPHATGRRAKKIRAKLHYFGPWSDPDGALAKYLTGKDALRAGKRPCPDAESHTVKDLANAFLNSKEPLVKASELSSRTWQYYKTVWDGCPSGRAAPRRRRRPR
jgi:hypothetical protein